MLDGTLAAIGFLHPTLVWFAIAAGAIPIVIHLINRRRYTRVPWAAMTFLLAARRRSARRVWIEQFLLLFARMALLVLLGLAIARPFVPASSRLGLSSSGVHRIIVLDNSLSMQARTADGSNRFDRARSYVSRLIQQARPKDVVSLVTMATPARELFVELPADSRSLRDRVQTIEVSQRSTDAAGALRLVDDILGDTRFPPANRVVQIVSDFPRSPWMGETVSSTPAVVSALERVARSIVAPDVNLHLVFVDPEVQDNLAISRLQISDPSRDQSGVPTLVGVGLPVRITADITNYGRDRARNRDLQLDVTAPSHRDAPIVFRRSIPNIDPGATRRVVSTVSFTEPGIHLIEARWVTRAGEHERIDDRLEPDDARFLSVDVRRDLAVLLVDGQPGITPLTGQAGYIATALSPENQSRFSSSTSAWRDAVVRTNVITTPELSGEVLSEYAAVMLCNVRRLPDTVWKRLESYVAGGGGLAVFSGDQVQVDHYNRYGFDEGRGLLPGTLSMAESPAEANGETGGSASLGFLLTKPPHPLVAEFDGRAESGLFLARVQRYLPFQLSGTHADVVLTYTNQEPALVASAFGKGRVLLCTTSCNMDWTNLPAKGDFVSLMLNSLAYLAPPGGSQRTVLTGDTVHDTLSAAETSLPMRVLTVGDHVPLVEPAVVVDGDSLVLAYGPMEKAGAVAVAVGAQIRIFAANVDTRESNLRGVTGDALHKEVDFPFRAVTLDDQHDTDASLAGVPVRATELASPAVGLVVVLLLIELFLAQRLGAQAASSTAVSGRRRVRGSRGVRNAA